MQYVLISVGIFFLLAVIYCSQKTSRLKKTYHCAEGEFKIRGTKDKFQIQKDNRFVFTIVDGSIVSYVDKDVSQTPVYYGGKQDGDY